MAVANPATATVVKTSVGGFALQNATPTIIIITTPNDGQMHLVWIAGSAVVTVAQTGGGVQVAYTANGVQSTGVVLFNGSLAVNQFRGSFSIPVDPGSQVTVSQTAALTAGAATVNVIVTVY